MTIATGFNLVEKLRELLGHENVLSSDAELLVYECDGFTIEKKTPDVAVFPQTTEQVAEVVRILQRSRCAVPPARSGNKFGGRMFACWRRCDDCVDADEGDSGNQSPRSIRGRAAWSRQHLVD